MLVHVWRLGEGSWPGHGTSILSQPQQQWGAPAGAAHAGGHGQSCSCCVWFPFGPRDLDKRVAFIDWEIGGGRGSRNQLLPFCFPKQTFIEHLLCASRCPICFSCIIGLNPHDSPVVTVSTGLKKRLKL